MMNTEIAYQASITREPFLFREMRITAGLVLQGLDDAAVKEQVFRENLFQYPTERSLRRMAMACTRRLRRLDDEEAVRLIAEAPAATARQLCLYAMMKDSRLVAEFMVQTVGAKYRQHDTKLSRADVGAFFLQLQEQSDQVAGWSTSTVKKIISVIMGILVQNEYLENARSTKLQPVYLQSDVRKIILQHGDASLMPAFNAF